MHAWSCKTSLVAASGRLPVPAPNKLQAWTIAGKPGSVGVEHLYVVEVATC